LKNTFFGSSEYEYDEKRSRRENEESIRKILDIFGEISLRGNAFGAELV